MRKVFRIIAKILLLPVACVLSVLVQFFTLIGSLAGMILIGIGVIAAIASVISFFSEGVHGDWLTFFLCWLVLDVIIPLLALLLSSGVGLLNAAMWDFIFTREMSEKETEAQRMRMKKALAELDKIREKRKYELDELPDAQDAQK